MNDAVIQVTNLGKRYRIGARQEANKTLAETLTQSVGASLRTARRLFRRVEIRREDDLIWALKEVSFEVRQGEVVGIIGRNGAGKSTLLKILSRITIPTEGRAIFRGRIGSLLEVGTGFHPELTGRENVYLNGAILGMRKAEIDRKFDEIVAFSEIDQFIDTPVKHYSSGMYVRLAFAVAAHLEPEILLVDEVLAVGDAAFQKKCLGKMGDVAQGGRTVLFVSHNMAAVQQLCPRTIVLADGRVFLDDATGAAIPRYLRSLENLVNKDLLFDLPRELTSWGNKARISKVDVVDHEGNPCSNLQLGLPFYVDVEFVCLEDLQDVAVVVGIDTLLNVYVTTASSEEAQQFFSGKMNETIKVRIGFDDLILNSGQFSLRIGLKANKIALDWLRQACFFEVSDFRATEAAHLESLSGVIRCTPSWERQQSEVASNYVREY
jgi:lipopolysaccharide transport system ATP-binding protein